MARAAVSSTEPTVPPNTGQARGQAWSIPGRRTSTPNSAVPLTLASRSVRGTEVPMSVRCSGALSGGSFGGLRRAASAASSPYVAL